ncbi:unnamed protein product, partial [Iphiclides podalirius]
MACVNEDYIARFKIKKSTVQALITFLKDLMKLDSAIVPIDKKVHIFLWLLTSDYSFSETGALFGLHKSSMPVDSKWELKEIEKMIQKLCFCKLSVMSL